MTERSIGLIELSSVAAGFEVADTMLKAGNVRLILSRSICSGKYMVLIGGETAAVSAAVAAGGKGGGSCRVAMVSPASTALRMRRLVSSWSSLAASWDWPSTLKKTTSA